MFEVPGRVFGTVFDSVVVFVFMVALSCCLLFVHEGGVLAPAMFSVAFVRVLLLVVRSRMELHFGMQCSKEQYSAHLFGTCFSTMCVMSSTRVDLKRQCLQTTSTLLPFSQHPLITKRSLRNSVIARSVVTTGV